MKNDLILKIKEWKEELMELKIKDLNKEGLESELIELSNICQDLVKIMRNRSRLVYFENLNEKEK